MKKLAVLLGLVALLGTAASANADYAKCAGCHGAKGEKKALGKSKVIAEMSAAEITAALKGYKDGSYGGPMKALMKGQVAALTDAQITSIADHIGKK
jgi:cytochrome c553